MNTRCRRVRVGVFAATLLAPAALQAQLTENFDDVSTLASSGWVVTNNSAPRSFASWLQGTPSIFPAYNGAANSYVSAGIANAPAGDGTVSTWLITPEQTLENGMVVSFFTRIRVPTIRTFPDRLELRMSTAGSSVDVGSSATSVGDFSTLLVSVNPFLNETDYPQQWTRFSATVSGLDAPLQGRFAFRYFVTDAGVEAINGDYIGVDAVTYGRPQAVPEPGAWALMTVGLFGLGAARARARARARRRA